MNRTQNYIIAILALSLLLVLLSAVSAVGQNRLERISMAERSDGLGYVFRFHLSEKADSVQLARLSVSELQLRIFDSGIMVTDAELPEDSGILANVNLRRFPDGIGAEFQFARDSVFHTETYPDAAGNDILLALERASIDQISDSYLNSRPLFELDEGGRPQDEDTTAGFLPERTVSADGIERSDSKNAALSGRTQQMDDVGYRLHRIRPGDPLELYLRMIPVEHRRSGSSGNLQPYYSDRMVLQKSLPASHPWMNHSFFSPEIVELATPGLSLYAPTFFGSTNDEIPWGSNDGPLWQGVGLNSRIHLGLRYERGPLLVSLRPEFVYSENQEYRLSRIPVQPGLSEFALPLTFADAPVRFGTESISQFNPGDSFIQLSYAGVAAGVSHERVWTGPAIYNPLLFSNNASGFFHGFLGTEKPLQTGVGHLEGKWLWGGLKESGYFDADSTNNLRYISAISLNFTPDLLPWLNFGVNRVYVSGLDEKGFQPADIVSVFSPWPRSGPRKEESVSPDNYFVISSLFATITLPEEGFEFYAEWGRNDYRRPLRDFLSMPSLNTGYVLGFWKRFTLTDTKRLLFNMEMTHMENSSVTEQLRDYNIWYTSASVQQGFTNRGQMIGSGIGPGASTQKFTLNYYDKWGFVGASLARVAHNMDRHFKYQDFFLDKSYVGFEGALLTSRHEIEFRYQLEAMVFLPFDFELQASYSIGKIENRYNIRLFDLTNRNIALTLRYAPSGFLR